METEGRRSLRARENHGGSEVTEVEDLDEAMGNSDGSASEESEGDPTYDVLEETRLSLSKISIKKSRKR
ncbi:hypothetical protein QJS10_CPA09g00051 [Acorus calamus]|uniref:Uncharacterized protein n=1 Tax=Acorus calamus TaxID=4465 RepID=A0AAV9E8J0_ACOCL|nr:hypothetical protein QJS10_CPA09g00051 [Acorus calamus]